MTEDVLYGRTGEKTATTDRSQDVQKVAGAANALAENEDAQAWAGGSAGIGGLQRCDLLLRPLQACSTRWWLAVSERVFEFPSETSDGRRQ